MLKSTNNLNILISCGSYSWGGLEMISLETARKLRESGLNVKIICSEFSQLETESLKNGFEVIPVFSKNKKTLGAITKLRKYLKANRTDIIHTNH